MTFIEYLNVIKIVIFHVATSMHALLVNL